MEDEKLAALGLSDQLPYAQGLLQGHSPFSVSQLPAPASNIEQQVVVNPKLQNIGLQMHFQSVLPIAMDRAIKEIVSSVMQRSVSIATQTTKELVLKDYAMESDETEIRNAAHLMVASLAGSLVHVTCKAIQTIDAEIAKQQSCIHKVVLSEALRPKHGCLSHSQQPIYEDFVRLPWQHQSSQNSNVAVVGPSTSVSGGLSQGYGSASSQLNPAIYSTRLGNTGMGAVAHSFDLGPEELDYGPAKQLSELVLVKKRLRIQRIGR